MNFPVKRCFSLLAVLLTAGGCFVPQGNFERIASRLEPGGSVYSITDFTTVQKRAARWDEEFAEAVLHNADIPTANRREFFRRRALAQMGWRLLALDTVKGWGVSSVVRKGVAEDDPVPVRNRFFALMPTDNERGSNGLVAAENREFRKELETLPEGVGLVLQGNLRPSFLPRSLKECGAVAEKWSGIMEFLATFPLTGNDGVWLVAASPMPGATLESFAGWRLKVELPDVDGKLFSTVAMMLNPKAAAGDRIAEISGSPGFLPVLLRRPGKVIFYNTPAAEQYFEKNTRRLVDTPRFAALTADLPDNGTLFVYIDELCMPKLKDEFAGIPLRFTADESGSTLLRREKDGWLWLENSAQDWNEQKMYLLLNLIDCSCDEFLRPLLGLPERAAEQEPETEKPTAPPQKQEDSSSALKLKKISAALTQYAAAHQGNYPPEDGKKGWEKLLAAGLLRVDDFRGADGKEIIYFGGLKRMEKSTLPVVIDSNNDHSFKVIFADGTIRQFQLERAGSLPRIVSFLHTQYHWEERVFRMMMLKAAQAQQEKNKQSE